MPDRYGSERRSTMALNDITLAFIGGGHITSIIADNLTRAGIVSSKQMIVSDPDEHRLAEICGEYSLIKTESNPQAVKVCVLLMSAPAPACLDYPLKSCSQI